MNYPIFIVSDNHFQRKSDKTEYERREKFYSLLNYINKSHGTLIIGGDFFDFWFHYTGYIPSEYIEIFEKLKDLKNNGIKIYYILGNHDYWDFGLFDNIFTEKTLESEFLFNKDGEKILILHGDGVLKEDYSYRLFRRIIRSKLCIYLFNILPPKLGYYIASKISKADKPAEYYKNNDSIKKKLKKYAKTRWDDADVVLLGHYHQSGIIEENNKKLIFLGDWLNKYLVTIYDDGEWSQINWDK